MARLRGWRLPVAVGVALVSSAAGAQALPPFFGPEAGAYDPVIDVVSSGALLQAQAAVTQDRKYVTINTQVSNSQLLEMQEFAFRRQRIEGPRGFVGGADPARPALGAGGILDRPGMVHLAPLASGEANQAGR